MRGTPQQIIDKYLTLARDAQLSNDRVAEQAFLQHAEHYTRMLGEAQREQAERQQQHQQYQQNQGNRGEDDRDGNDEAGREQARDDRGQRRDNRQDRTERQDRAERQDARDNAAEAGHGDALPVVNGRDKRRAPREEQASPTTEAPADHPPAPVREQDDPASGEAPGLPAAIGDDSGRVETPEQEQAAVAKPATRARRASTATPRPRARKTDAARPAAAKKPRSKDGAAASDTPGD